MRREEGDIGEEGGKEAHQDREEVKTSGQRKETREKLKGKEEKQEVKMEG